jgi:transcriptional regulator with XRE-family HTH domain
MSEVAQLIATLKARLRAQGLTYRDVARAMGLSEVSVKRLFKSGRISLDRLAEVASLLGYTLAELTQEAQAAMPRLRTLAEAQERELVSDQRLLLVAVCALNHWTMAEIVATYRLAEAECLERLLRLDRLGLVDLLPGNRIRIKVARDFDWLPDGPIRRFFQTEGQDDFLGNAFLGPGEELVFSQGMLTEAAVAEVRKELGLLRQKFAALHDEGLTVPLGRRRGTGLLLAMREWEPRVFAQLRRSTQDGGAQ